MDRGKSFRLGVLGSGKGSNFAAIADAITAGQIPAQVALVLSDVENAGILDPWGHYYVYYYKSARNAALWQAPGYILYSVGPDGAHTAPPNTGLWSTTQINAANNADNVYATVP